MFYIWSARAQNWAPKDLACQLLYSIYNSKLWYRLPSAGLHSSSTCGVWIFFPTICFVNQNHLISTTFLNAFLLFAGTEWTAWFSLKILQTLTLSGCSASTETCIARSTMTSKVAGYTKTAYLLPLNLFFQCIQHILVRLLSFTVWRSVHFLTFS